MDSVVAAEYFAEFPLGRTCRFVELEIQLSIH